MIVKYYNRPKSLRLTGESILSELLIFLIAVRTSIPQVIRCSIFHFFIKRQFAIYGSAKLYNRSQLCNIVAEIKKSSIIVPFAGNNILLFLSTCQCDSVSH